MRFPALVTITLACMLAGCQFRGASTCDDNCRLDFNSAISDLASSQSCIPGRDLQISEPSIGSAVRASPMLIRETLPDGSTNEVEVFDTYDFGPLDDFSFSDDSNFHRIRLEDAIKMALTNSPVVRDLGGLILRAPDAKTTDVDPSRAYLDPRFGEEAALSAFDATYNSQLLFQKNDNLFNNQFIGDEGAFQQDLARYSAGISKIAATGGQFGFKNVIDYELNNSPSNRFNGNGDRSYAYDVSLEAEFRQPLFQGAGTLFNRVAGPNNAPGIYNGVSIARTNTDVALADFETKIRDLISDVENTYWDLYFAYRDLEAKIDARNGAYEIWQNLEANRAEKSAAIIGQAKEQYYRFAAEVEESIHGRLNEGTRTNNGSSSGTFRRIGGVRTAERRFRLIVGMPLNDSKLVVPSDVPSEAVSEFDWQSIRDNALTRRAELRRQRWVLKRRELELLASKNLLLPRIDLLGRYRLKGFGHDLFGHGNELQRNGNLATQLDSSALGGLFNNDLQEWELGIDTTIPIGFRRQHSAVRHAQLNLAREKSILSEQQRQVIFGLSNAVGELRRASKVRSANRNRLEAANEQYAAILNIYREQDTTIDLVLEAQRRVIEAKLQHFQSQVEYMLAVKAIHFEQGTLLQYHNVLFGEAEASFANFDSVLSADAMSIEQPQFEYAPQTSEPANSTRPEFEPANQSSQQIEKNDSINDIDDALPKPKSDVGQPSSSSPKPDEPRSIIDRKINILDGAPNSGASKRDKKNPFRRNMFAPN